MLKELAQRRAKASCNFAAWPLGPLPLEICTPKNLSPFAASLTKNPKGFRILSDASLLQVIPAEYAFVLHTANPMTGAKGELFGEAVVGMGEALVGNQPGRALSFSAAAGGSQPAVTILSLPSKRAGLFSPSGSSNIIFRSDSNGEDLEAFAGAGMCLLPVRESMSKASTMGKGLRK